MISAVSAFCLALVPLAATGIVTDQTARATGVAGAYTAQVDDPTAVFFNPGALSLLTKKKGVSAGTASSSFRPFHFQGRVPGDGAGTVGKQSASMDLAPSLFFSAPVTDRAVLGGAAYSSIRTRSQWEEPDEFSGRYLATASSIEAYDVVSAGGLQLSPTLGIGAGAVYRSVRVALDRRLGTNIGGVKRDIASEAIETDLKSTLGWNAGVLFRPSPRFSLGAVYRSPIRMQLKGIGTLTQIATGDPQADALVAASFPFDQDLAMTAQLETPAQLNAGIAVAVGEPLLIEVDVHRTRWSTLRSMVFVFPNNRTLDAHYELGLETTLDYRAGLRFQFPTGPIIRLGYAIENSPQPETTLSPFFSALDRNTVTAGFGLDWLDIAVGWTRLGRKTVTTSAVNFNGDYSGNEWTLVVTATK
jgi:long-chain fatty acid transport protein